VCTIDYRRFHSTQFKFSNVWKNLTQVQFNLFLFFVSLYYVTFGRLVFFNQIIFITYIFILFLESDKDYFGDIPNEKFNVIMRCAFFAKENATENLKEIKEFCSKNKITSQKITELFKNCLVSKKIIYQNYHSTGNN
jgi:hypothetical protein